MHQAFIELKNGLPVNTDIMCAAEGFEQLGYQIRLFTREDIVTEKFRLLYYTSPFVGCIDTMKALFHSQGTEPGHIDFPAEINPGRRIVKQPLNQAIEQFDIDSKPVFIKPVETKLFSGMVLRNYAQRAYFSTWFKDNPDCWVSDEMEFVSEFRCFVHRKKLQDCRVYQGSFKWLPHWDYVLSLIDAYTTAPIAYTLDVARTAEAETVLVECNDFWAIGSYGLEPKTYARMLADRYFEIMGVIK